VELRLHTNAFHRAETVHGRGRTHQINVPCVPHALQAERGRGDATPRLKDAP